VNKVSNLRSDGNNLTVLFLDIDDFKQYNDQFGHQEGDYVLQKVAQTITQEARGEDIASRYGGEEFTLILGCDFETACRVAERLRSSVEERCSTFADPNVKRSITVSVGLASFGVDADAGDKLVKIADARMYEAKRRGKNQVYIGDVDLEEAEVRDQGHGSSTSDLGIVPG
jgi:diguanylate cyclase (GGDEF)-like protein